MRHRFPHRLSPLKAAKAPKYVIFFDTETKEKRVDATTVELKLHLGYAIATRRGVQGGYEVYRDCEFTSRDVFARWVEDVCTGREKYYLVAHNVGFDLRITSLTRYLSKKGWKRSWTVIEGNNFMMRFRRGETTILIMNNMQLFPVSLKSLGDSIGSPKLEVDFRTASDAELLTYCKQDVEVMRVAWSKWYHFISVSDLGNFRTTVGSQALSAFRHRFKDHEIYIHTNPHAIALERESYHGGRVECFRLGTLKDGPYHALDVNSMYPHIMRNYKVPTKLLGCYENVSKDDFDRVRVRFGFVARATVLLTDAVLPSIQGGRMVFPIGQVSGVFTKPELDLALKHGRLVEVSEIALYEESRVFASYVDFFYESRKRFRAEGNDSFDYFCKLLLNSLYGKFGQKITEFEKVAEGDGRCDHSGKTYDLRKGKEVKYRVIDGIVEFECGEHESNDTFVAIASYITAAARAYLSSLILTAGRENVMYCDTDSLFVNDIGLSRLRRFIDPHTLGKLKLENTADEITIIGPKRYRFGEKERSKGIRKNARRIGENTYLQEHFETFTGSLRRGSTDTVRIHTVQKTLKDKYLKGVVGPDGVVMPFVLPQQPSQLP